MKPAPSFLLAGALLAGLVPCAMPLQAQHLTREEVALPGLDTPARFETRLLRLVSPTGEPERYEPMEADAKTVVEEPAPGTRIYRTTLTNPGTEPLLAKLTARAQIPQAQYAWWNGYANQISQRFEGDSLLSMWFPANAALGGGRAFVLGLDPAEVYSRVESRHDKAGRALLMEVPLVLEPGASRTVSFVVTSCPARYGYRDVVQHYYDLFAKAYAPVEGIDPAVLSTQSTYLYWKPQNYGQPLTPDMIRRFSGGAGGWEWCYKPFVRGGDWATTDEWSLGYKGQTKESLETHRQETRARFDEATQLGVAPMYYLNVFWSEQSLMQEHFPEVLFNPETDLRCWGGTALRGLYPWKNRYADLFTSGIRKIAEDYPSSRGIAWDSCFGHSRIPGTVAGVNETVEKSYDRGERFALTGVAYTHLLDLNRSLSSGGFRRANAVNLKLVAPYYIGLRSDSALYEGTPVEDPKRLIRFELYRARLGTPKALSWHKGLIPSKLKWIPWETLTTEEALEAYRQVHEDALFLSYYWGGLPSPGMPTLGIRRTFEAVPELIGLTRLGWQPSPGVDAEAPYLLARYGSGAGAEVVVINPEFTPGTAELFFPKAYWGGKVPYLARKDGQPLRQTLTPEGVLLSLETPRRSVTLLRVLGLGEPPTAEVALATEATLPAGAPAQWRLKAGGALQWPTHFVAPAEYGNVAATAEGQTLTLKALPQVASDRDAAALREWFGAAPRAIVEGEAAAARWVKGWFAAQPAAQDAEAPAARKISLVVEPGAAGPRITTEGEGLTLSAPNAEALQAATHFFLRQMDLAYPACGLIPPYKDDAELARLQLPGTVLEPEPKSGYVLRPTLAERMRKAFPPLAEQ